MIKFQSFPRSSGIDEIAKKVVECFIINNSKITSETETLSSNEVLKIVKDDLEQCGMLVENGKTQDKKIQVPVLYGLDNNIDQYFEADALSNDKKIVLEEVEAGRAVVNYQFLKDIFQASMMHKVETLILAVRNDYRGNNDFKKIFTFLETLYINGRITLPLKSIVLIGY